MGLAPYGEPKYLDQMEKIVNITNNDQIKQKLF